MSKLRRKSNSMTFSTKKSSQFFLTSYPKLKTFPFSKLLKKAQRKKRAKMENSATLSKFKPTISHLSTLVH